MTDGIDRDRLTKLEALRDAGVDPYPPRTPAASPIAEILAGFEQRMGSRVTIAGRLTEIRDFGKLRFSHLHDRSGHIQIGFQRDRLGDWWPNRKKIEPADLVVITGEVGRTNKGEDTIWAEEVVLASKTLRRAPTTWFGLKNVESRYRQRYVDLLSNQEVRELFTTRSRLLRETRVYFDSLDYLEVETPILQPIFGGATARPFNTHHNALDMSLFLRIAPELYLKRLIVGGMERVYEIGRVFRNEGISTRHNPEFTMLESYEAWADYEVVIQRVEGLMAHLVETVRGGDHKVTFRDHELDLKPPFQRARYTDLLAEHNGGLDFFDEPAVMARAKELGLKTKGADGKPMPFEKVANDIFEETVEDKLIGPMFVTHYPVPICPLAKADPDEPRLAERFEFFCAGMELANAFSELNDPIDQEQRFAAQLEHVDDESPSQMDEDYVTALEFGMPPAGGLGIGMDRLAMLFTGQDSIREVVLFPLLRQLAPQADGDAPAEESAGS